VYPSGVRRPRECTDFLERNGLLKIVTDPTELSHILNKSLFLSLSHNFSQFLFLSHSLTHRALRGYYFIFTFIRNPYTRSVSSFYYSKKKSTKQRQIRKSLEESEYGEWLRHPQGSLSPIHWSSQLGCLLLSPLYSGTLPSTNDDLSFREKERGRERD